MGFLKELFEKKRRAGKGLAAEEFDEEEEFDEGGPVAAVNRAHSEFHLARPG